MTRVRSRAAQAAPLVTVHRIFVATLAMAAVIIGLVAMHSAGMVHSDSHPATAVAQGHDDHAASTALRSGAAHSAAAPVGTAASHAHADLPAATPLLSCDENCAAECAMMALTCMVLFILSTLIFLGRFPAVLRRIIDRGHELVLEAPRAMAHIYSPSLTVLSISRT